MDPKRRREAVDGMELRSEGIHGVLSTKEIIFKLIQEVFASCRQGFWYHILPTEDDFFDISHATGVEWSMLLPLLVNLGLIEFNVQSVVKEARIQLVQWTELANSISKHV